MTHAVDFLVDVLALSEPFGSTGVNPEPELVGVAYDDAAFLEYVREMDSEGPDGDED